MAEIVNQEAANTIIDMHNGVHAALQALVNDKDLEKAELILRQLDHRFARLTREAKTIR
jgi:hypothetical protein